MDIKLAAYGINLSTATRVYFVSPVWQTAVERQAIKRAHRIGQTKPVYVETLVIGGSMEEEILKRRSELGEEKSTATPTDDGKMKQILSAAEFVPSPPGMPDLAMEQSPVSYTSAERSASARASIPRIGDPIPFLKPKRQAVRQADVEADEGAGPSRRRIRFAETDEDTDEERDTDGEKDTGDGASRSSGLVDYVSSDDEEQANGEMEEDGSSSVITMSMKRKREEAEVEEEMKPKKGLPPLPDAFLELYPDKNRKSDNPSVHQGRVRATPHVPGNWATHVYIEVTVNSDFRDLLAKIVTTAQGPSSNGADAVIHPVLDDSNGDGDGTRSDASSQSVKLHVSLSRCVFLKVFQLDRFAELLTKALDGRKRWFIFKSLVRSFRSLSFIAVLGFPLHASRISPMRTGRGPLWVWRLGLGIMR
ncbi:hypothetical protein BC936DRAFT_140881 [Jimgerdemannia flammicorona]|uniref:U6 snRNA phosphodiesterase 1 n=1 Tax=Jimgerdemannia flammicorona TaxID=994334 RepID=A0A433A385_9FUNG|nr:hypothetical protein BC936DRAFT_140881 [Jimgerdemannia flammicorona]